MSDDAGDDPAASWLSGLLNAFAAGTLTHVGVQMFGSHEPEGGADGAAPHGGEPPERAGASLLRIVWLKAAPVCLGAALMSVLAIWAVAGVLACFLLLRFCVRDPH